MTLKNRVILALKILLKKNPGKLLKQKYKKSITEYIPSLVFDNKLLAKKNVFITGTGPMIGSSIAIEMAKQGANIYFTDIIEKRCLDLEERLNEYQIKYKSFVSDISKKEDTDNILKYLSEKNINIDILVNNVGINLERDQKGIKEFDIEKYKKTFDINLFGPMYLTKNISKSMINEKIKGNIIFTTSVHQEIVGLWPSYSSSKSALLMIIKELASELAEYQIRVNGIEPGWVKIDKDGSTFDSKKNILHQTTIEPHYIGRAAVYLASEYFSKFTTGTIIKVDSGATLRPYKFIEP